MLKKYAVLLLSFSLQIMHADVSNHMIMVFAAQAVVDDLINTTTTGVITGAATGALSNCLENNGVWWPISWLATAKLRQFIVKTYTTNAHYNNEYINQELLDYSSHLSSWISYVLSKYTIKPLF